MIDLYYHQDVRARFLADHKRAADFSCPGVGKTGSTIVAATNVGARHILIICPAIACHNWKRELGVFAPRYDPKIQIIKKGTDKVEQNVVICSYDLMSRPLIEEQLRDRKFDVTIIDEAHLAKSPKSRRSKVLWGQRCDGSGVIHSSEYVWALTGTPTPNHAGELFPMVNSLWPKNFQDLAPGYLGFASRYCNRKQTRFGPTYYGGRNMAELNERLAGCYIRHRKEEVLEELPEKEVISVLLDPTEIPQGMTELEHTPDVRKLKELFRKDKAEKAANFARTSPDLSRLRRLTGLAKAPAAVQYINNVIDGGCKKLVVFRHHREVGEVLEQELQHHGAVGITAGQTAEQRQICIDRFQNDPDTKVCVASLGAASTAITLHAASDAIFVESDWSPATNIQAANRIHRIGQRRHVLIRFLALPDSVDEVIQRVVAEKVRVTDKLLPSGGA